MRFLQLTKLAPSDRIDTLYLAAVILADKFSNDDNFCDLASTICLLCGVRAEVLVTQENRILGVLRASSLMVAPAVFRQVLRLVFEVRWGRLKQRGALAILERLSSDADDGLHPLPFDSPHDGAPEDSSWADFLLPGLGSGSMLGALPALLARRGCRPPPTSPAPSRPRSTHRSTPARSGAAPLRAAAAPAVAESRRRRRRRRAARAARAAARRRRRRQRLPRRRRLGRRRRHRRARRRDARARRGAAAAAEAAAAEAAAAERVDATRRSSTGSRRTWRRRYGGRSRRWRGRRACSSEGRNRSPPRRRGPRASAAGRPRRTRRRAARRARSRRFPRSRRARCGRSSPVQPEAASAPTEEPLAAPAPRGGARCCRRRRRATAGGAELWRASRPPTRRPPRARAAAVAAAAAAALSSDADAAQPQA